MKAIFISLCAFSITFAASATFILFVLKVPTFTIFLYTSSIRSNAYLLDPEVILTIFSIVFLLSHWINSFCSTTKKVFIKF